MKKSTGIVRNIDSLGRIVLPKELRRVLEIQEGDPVEVFVNGEEIILRKYAPGCSLCGNVERELTSLYPEKLICKTCVTFIAKEQSKLFPQS